MTGAKQKKMLEISDLRREILYLRSICLFPPSPGGTLIFSCIRRLGLFLGLQNFEFQYLWDFQKTEYFWGHEDSVDIFGVITKLDYTVHFSVFSEGQGTK